MRYLLLVVFFSLFACTSTTEGEIGPEGPEGPQGPEGPVGPEGSQGPEGPKGPEGSPGKDGLDGVDGADGVGCEATTLYEGTFSERYRITCGDSDPIILYPPKDGEQGPDGRDGRDVLVEAVSTELDECEKGGVQVLMGHDTTDDGEIDSVLSEFVLCHGFEGEQGPQGERGPQGEQGLQGETGPQGERGPKGLQGEPGPQGEKGLQGETGPPGPQGERGIQGYTGPRGPRGYSTLFEVVYRNPFGSGDAKEFEGVYTGWRMRPDGVYDTQSQWVWLPEENAFMWSPYVVFHGGEYYRMWQPPPGTRLYFNSFNCSDAVAIYLGIAPRLFSSTEGLDDLYYMFPIKGDVILPIHRGEPGKVHFYRFSQTSLESRTFSGMIEIEEQRSWPDCQAVPHSDRSRFVYRGVRMDVDPIDREELWSGSNIHYRYPRLRVLDLLD